MTVTSAGNNSTTEARLIVKNNMEIIADTFTITDTLGEEILSVDESNVRYNPTLRLEISRYIANIYLQDWEE